MKSKFSFAVTALASVALFAMSCGDGNSAGSDGDAPERATMADVEEINAKRGDACECVDSKLTATNEFIAKAEAGEFATTAELNSTFAAVMDGCMKPIGHAEADFVWSQKMMECESFSAIKDALIKVQTLSRDLKLAEQEEFVEGRAASEVLDKLQDTH